jgi:hypothetical protein
MATRDEIRDGSVVRLVGCNQQMVVKSIEGDFARCIWLDISMKGNSFLFPLQNLERVSW